MKKIIKGKLYDTDKARRLGFDGKCHTEEMRYNDAKQWLAAHPQ